MKKMLTYLTVFTVCLTLAVLYPYSLHPASGLPNSVDPVFYAWNLFHNATNALKGMSALLDTNMFYPLTNTIAYSDTMWGISLFINPVIWITHNPVLAENIAIFLSFPLSAAAMFLLAMYITGNPLAAAAGGLFYAFSYPRLSQIGHLPTVSNQWLPLYVLYLLKFLDEGTTKNAAYIFLFYILALASSMYFGVFLIPVTAVIMIADLYNKFRQKSLSEFGKRMRTILPLILPFFIVIGICVFPYVRLKIENPEIKRSMDDLTHLRAEPVDFISILPTSLIKFTGLPIQVNEHALYPTVTLLMLSAAALFKLKKKFRLFAATFLIIGIVSLVLSFGNEYAFSFGPYSTGTLRLPYYYLYKFVPIFQIVRVTARFYIFVILSLSVLAAIGLTQLIEKKNRRFIAYAGVLLFLLEIWQIRTPYVTVPDMKSVPAVYRTIKSFPEPVAIAELPVSLFYHGDKMEEQLYKQFTDLKEPDTYALETYRLYYSTYHGKHMINGYSGYLPDTYNRLSESLESFPSDYSIGKLRDIGITHTVVHLWQYDDVKKADMIRRLSETKALRLTYSDDWDRIYEIIKSE